MNNIKKLSIANFLAFVITVIVNGLANALPINGRTTGELSDMYPNLFVPTGLTFSIWGVIYLLLLMFSTYQLVLAFGKPENAKIIHEIGPWFIISSIANCSWILAWHYVLPEISLVIMIILLISLIKIYLGLEQVKSSISKTTKWLIYPCFSVYLGWITVATIANITTVLVDWGWNGGMIGASTWTIVVMSVAIGMGIYFAIIRKNIPYTIVIAWALYGIYLKRSAAVIPEEGIILVSQFGMFVCAFSILFILIRKMVKPTNKS